MSQIDSSVYAFFARIGQPLPKPTRYAGHGACDTGEWRLCKPYVGQIAHLPELRGTMRATNGVLLFIEGENGQIARVHLSNFIPDKEQSDELKELVKKSSKRGARTSHSLKSAKSSVREISEQAINALLA